MDQQEPSEQFGAAPEPGRKLSWPKALNVLLKTALVIGLGWAIYRQVLQREGGFTWLELWRQPNAWGKGYWLAAAMVLMPVNWLLEAIKWRQFMQAGGEVVVSLRTAIRAVLAGVTLSLVAPNRTGDYLGRVLAVSAADNSRALMATLAGNYCQLLILIAAGLPAFALFATHYGSWPGLQMWVITGGSVLLILVLLVIAWNLSRIIRIARRYLRWSRLNSWWAMLALLERYGFRELSLGILLSLLRYLTYTGQYYFFLRFCAGEIPPGAALVGAGTIFLLQTTVPLPPALSLVARGEIALLVWGSFGLLGGGILAATYGLFILNLALPALLGMITVVKTNILKSLGYEKNLVATDRFGDATGSPAADLPPGDDPGNRNP